MAGPGRQRYNASVSLRIVSSDCHPRMSVDPFGQLPCKHPVVWVHITDGDSMGDDLLECTSCKYVVSLRDLFAAMSMPPGLLPAQ